MANIVYLNGVALNPSEIEYDEDKYQTEKRMADASLRVAHRAVKGKWTLTWNNIHESKVLAIRSLYRVIGPMTYINEFNESFTVMTLSGSLSITLSAESMSMSGVKYYNVELSFEQT